MPTPTSKLSVSIIHPDKVLFIGLADYIVAPGRQSNFGIMPGHTPFFAELIKGDIYISGEKEDLVAIEGGILKVRADSVVILADA